MPQLLLRGKALGDVKGVLFDKDGTLSISEPQLITLAEARVFLCLERVAAGLREELLPLLQRAYGLRERPGDAGGGGGGRVICPAGITAVASREHNLIATATALVQVGLGWPEALSLSEEVFSVADGIDARRAGEPRSLNHAGETTTLNNTSEPIVEGGVPAPGAGRADNVALAGLATHLDSAGRPSGGTSRTTEGLRAWLEQLKAASVICAVISNDDVSGIEHFLASHGLKAYFSGIWSAEHRPRKPDPQAVHGLCSELGLEAADCALIGDANSDLRMAVAAGIPHRLALGYTAAWSTPPPLAEPHPLVHHWSELSLG